MSIQDNQKIYNFPVNSRQDLEQALNHCTLQEERKIDKILSTRYPSYMDIENFTPNNLHFLVKDIYWKTLGFSNSDQVLCLIEKYRDFLKSSATFLHTGTTPQLIRSLKCHQTALGHYLKANRETIPILILLAKKSGLREMETVNKLAEGISRGYNYLDRTLAPIGDLLKTLSISLLKEIDTIQATSEEIARDPAAPMKHERLNMLNQTIISLGRASESLNKISGYYYAQRKLFIGSECHCLNLSKSKLADEQKVETIESGKLPNEESQAPIDNSALIAQMQNIRLQRESFEKQASAITGGNFPLIVKTGRELLFSTPTPVKGIQEEFEESYLNWLTLVKVNQMLIQSLNMAAGEMEQIQNMISTVEQDPLAIALRQHSHM